MAPASITPLQSENTAFIKELQWKENRSQDEFLGSLLSDEALPKDHIALKHSSSSSSGGGTSHVSESLSTKTATKKSKSVDGPQIYTQLSINLWKRLNAGYLIPRQPPAGVTRSTFTYDPSMIEYPSKELHRKRDFYSEYNEAAARFKLVHGNKKPLSKPKRLLKGGEDTNVAKDNGLNPPLLDGAQSAKTDPDSTIPITNQSNQNLSPNGSLSAQNSAPTPNTLESKAAEPSS